MKILMVCLGNICRSPMAQGIMEKLVKDNQLDWSIDSAGTNGYHNGESPDPRAVVTMKEDDIDISHQISRKIRPEDLEYFDKIYIMEQSNWRYVMAMCKNQSQKNKLYYLTHFSHPDAQMEVPDPYYDSRFQQSKEIIFKACEAIIKQERSI